MLTVGRTVGEAKSREARLLWPPLLLLITENIMEMFDGTDSGSEHDYLGGEEERTADEYNSEGEMRSTASDDRGRDEGSEQREPENDVSFTEGEYESQFIEAVQLDSRIHSYDASEIRNFATQEWWGLPLRFRGLLLPAVISLVVHAISLAFTLKFAAVLCPLVEFLQIAGQVLALQFLSFICVLLVFTRRMNASFLNDS